MSSPFGHCSAPTYTASTQSVQTLPPSLCLSETDLDIESGSHQYSHLAVEKNYAIPGWTG